MPRGVRKAVSPEVEEPKEAKAVSPEVYSVFNNGVLVRVFDKRHGDQAEELAKSFAKKFGYTVK